MKRTNFHMQVFALALAVASLLTSSIALADEKCARIENDLQRLVCYDSVYQKAAETSNLSTNAAFEAFDALVDYPVNPAAHPRLGGPGFEAKYALADCMLMWRHTYRTERNPFVYLTSIDMAEVDVSKTGVSYSGNMNLVMKRGNPFRWSYFVPNPQTSFKNWVGKPVPDPRTRHSDLANLNWMAGYFGSIRYQETVEKRSLDIAIAPMYMEDIAEITSAFLDLARSCQK